MKSDYLARGISLSLFLLILSNRAHNAPAALCPLPLLHSRRPVRTDPINVLPCGQSLCLNGGGGGGTEQTIMVEEG
jgi:hypothetical protein